MTLLKKNVLGDQVAKALLRFPTPSQHSLGGLKSGMAIVERQQEAPHANQERVFGMIDSINSRITDT